MPNLNVRDLGVFIREQRRTAQISLRQLASQAGVSNPYLSQIERGLRRPSAEILQQIAKALRISAEVLYVQAGILEERPGDESVISAIFADETLSERQKQVVLDIYEAFCRENSVAFDGAPPDAVIGSASPPPDAPAPGASTSTPPRARRSTAASGSTANGTGTGKARSTAASGRSAGTGGAAGTNGAASTRRRAAAGPKSTEPASSPAPKRRTTKRSATPAPADSAPAAPDPAESTPATPGPTDLS